MRQRKCTVAPAAEAATKISATDAVVVEVQEPAIEASTKVQAPPKSILKRRSSIRPAVLLEHETSNVAQENTG